MEKCVSVIVPSYNRAHLLKKTIPSYIQENVGEVIIVDDASTDNTFDVINELKDLCSMKQDNLHIEEEV